MDRAIEIALSVLRTEAAAVEQLRERIDTSFVAAVHRILDGTGRLVVLGMGKAGIVGAKISATFASTKTPSLCLHPADALHGDLGRIVKNDVVLALSNSGETDEVLRVLPLIKKIGAAIIALTGNPRSNLARHSDIVLDIGKIDEACPMGLAPTASTTAMLAMGDALAMAVLDARHLSKEEYAFYHPGGELGRRLLKVADVMRDGDANPVVDGKVTVREALIVMTETPGRPGAVSAIGPDGRLVGVFTDGDLRRRLQAGALDFLNQPLEHVMSRNPKTITPERLATEGLQLLRDHKIDQLPVVDESGVPVGLLDVQDLLTAGLV